ncbi:VCBS domain-containing protein [Comamonas testosteroni]|uniref:VCBS domain-containing protein n=1 Tax=Comamonas testosteroni TaxID=285 RepID=UPI001C10710E|nr:VCBS domain-containing protein [Comamonas testosteroni]
MFTYTVKDGDGDLSTATLTINVADVTGTPVTTTGGSVTEAGLAGGTSAGQGNVYSGSLSLQSGWTAQAASGTTANGTYTVKADGTYTFTLTSATTDVAGQAETNSFTYTAKDANGNTVTNTVTVTIVDDTPVAASINAGSLTEDAAQTSLSGTVAPAAGNSNSFGGDGAATTGATGWGSVSAKLGATTVNLGDYGKLTQNSDGTWKFELDNSKPATQALTTGQSIIVTMGYTLTDKDGDQRSNNVTFQINGVNDAFPDKNTTTEDHAVSGNVLLNDEGYVSGGALAITSFSVNGSTYSVGASAVNVMDAGKVVGTISLAANGGYVFTPSSDWSGKVPTVTYTTNTGVTSTLDIDVTPVADKPLVSVVLGAGSVPITTSIDVYNVLDPKAGHTVTAYNANGTVGTVSNSIKGTDHDGFGVKGGASGDDAEIGNGSGTSEKLAIQFNTPVTSITVQFAWLAGGEWARYQMFDEAGKAVALGYDANGNATAGGLYGFVKGGTDRVDTQFSLSVPAGSIISKIVFDAPRVNDDYLINKVTYTTAVTYPATIVVTPTDIDYSESVSKVVVEVAKGVTLSAGTQVDATHWVLPLQSNGSYSVQIDSVTKVVTITGLNVTVPDNVTSGSITVTGTVQDGTDTNSASTSTGSVLAASDVATTSVTASKGPYTLADAFSTSATDGTSKSNTTEWKWATPAQVGVTGAAASDQGWVTSAATKTGWVSNETFSNANGSEFRVNGGALQLRDDSGSSSDTRLLTPIYTTGNQAGEKLQFNVTVFDNYTNSSRWGKDSVTWTLYKLNSDNSWSAVQQSGASSVLNAVTGTGLITTNALDANTVYRIYIDVNDTTSSGNGNLTVSLDNFKVLDVVALTGTAVSGNLLTNDHADSSSTLSVSHDHGMSWKTATASGVDIEGDYGTLHISKDGSYTYTPLTSPKGDIYQTQQDVFTYKVLAADGSHAEAYLTVALNASNASGTTVVIPGTAPADAVHEVYGTPNGDTLLGSDSDDWFIWTSSDHGTPQAPAQDVIQNFGKSGNDKLVLNDLLDGEEKSSDLSKFLNFSKSGADTVVKVSHDGHLGDASPSYDQLITFKGVDLTAGHALTTTADQNALIKELIDQGKLKIDHS